MVLTNGYNMAGPNHRQNRRRERPGSRIRKTRRSHIQSCMREDCDEGILDAHDSGLSLPSDRSKPSPLLRQNFDQSWQRWKARQAEEKAIAEMDQIQLEQEQIKLFGGEIDDDDLYKMGILYHDKDILQEESNTVSIEVPSTPVFFLRTRKPRRRVHRSTTWRDLPLYLSMSDLSHDVDIARLLSSPSTTRQPIQHRETTPTPNIPPQSLPPTTALESAHGSNYLLDNTISNSLLSFDFLNSGDWTFIGTAPQTPLVSTPSSEPETWIVLSDDS